MPFYHLYTKEVREIPHGILKLTLPRLATPAVKAVESFLSSPKQCPDITFTQTYIEKDPIGFKTDFWPCPQRGQTWPTEVFGTDGVAIYYPLYLGDVGHVSGTTSLRSPSCALRSVKCV